MASWSARLRIGLASIAAIGGGSLAACRGSSSPSRWLPCHCSYVTDFDQPGRVDVEICATPADAPPLAESCARDRGVGAVSECVCSAPNAASTCVPSGGVCRDPLPGK